jgi:hypothetical protein
LVERTARIADPAQTTFDAIPDLIWQKNIAGTLNPSMARLTGLAQTIHWGAWMTVCLTPK